MIQPPHKKTNEKTESNLRGARMVILSLAVMTVGGGLMLFVYAFSKAQQSFSKTALPAECNTALSIADAAALVSVSGLQEKQLDAVVTLRDGSHAIVRLDRCSGEEISRQMLVLGK